MEKKSRKEWIKTVAIIFLAVLLVLTFFSNTIQNYSLPEVAAQYCYSGSITNRVRGQGVIESADPYKVEAKQTRTISEVKVREGDIVEKGDVLYILEEGESDELKEAEKTLQTLQSAYDKALISGTVNLSTAIAVENGATSDINKVKEQVDAYQKKLDAYDATIESLNKQIEIWSNGSSNDLAERKTLEDAKKDLYAWSEQDKLNQADIARWTKAQADNQATVNSLSVSVSDNNTADNQQKLTDARKNLEEAEKKLQDAVNAKATSAYNITYCQHNVDAAQKVIDDKIADLTYQRNIANANKTATKADMDEYVGKATTEIDLANQIAAIKEQEKVVNTLKEESTGIEVTAPVDGTILSMSKKSGETINPGDELASIQTAGKGYTLSMTVTNEQARLVNVGDEAEITNSWWYSEVHARVSAIRPDKTNPSKNKMIIFDIEGDVSNGQTLSLTVGNRTASYDNIVPNSAIREDNKGKFVYRIISKSTPLGNRYYVEKVEVTVVAEDETESAITGALEGWDFILTNSSKPVSDGQLVRLKDN